MIIYWGADRSEDLPVENDRFETLVSDLLRARRKGHHLVVLEDTVYLGLRELHLSRKDLAILDRLSDEYTQTGRAIDLITPAIRIINTFEERVIQVGDIFHVSLGSLLNSNILDEPKFVIENAQRDGFVFNFALQILSDHPISFDFVHGGGADISDVFEYQIRQKRVVACSVDSDRYTPLSLRNEKLSAVKTRVKRVSWPLSFAMSPNCREIENLIPPNVIFELPSGKSSPSNAVVQRICESEHAEGANKFWNFFDIKKGIIHRKVKGLSKDELSWLRDKLLLGGIDVEAIATEDLGDDPDTYVYLSGYGDRVIDQMQRAKTLHSDLEKAIIDRECREAFSDVFDSLLAIFASIEEVLT